MAIDPRRIEVIDDETAACLRRMTPAQKWEMANRMVVQAREMLLHHLRTAHPEWSEAELQSQLRKRMSHDGAA